MREQMRAFITATGKVYRQQKNMEQERLSQSEELKNHIERVMLFRNRWRARASAREKTKVRIAALAAVRKTLQQASDTDAPNIKTVFNVSLYLLLLDQDLAYFTNDLVQAIGDRRRAFIAKQEAVLLYEAAEDVRQLLGREFRAALNALNVPLDVVDRTKALSIDLNKFWDKHREFLKTIRNVLAAHRDHDALRYMHDLESLKPLEVMNRAVEFSALLELLVQELTRISVLTSNPGVILRDILSSGAKRQG